MVDITMKAAGNDNWHRSWHAGHAEYLARAEKRRARAGRRAPHDPPASTPELRAEATAARMRAYALRRDVARALFVGELGFIELRNLVRTEQAISRMRLKHVLKAMEWDHSTLTQWRLRDLTYTPGIKLGQLRDKQWQVLISAWPMPHQPRMNLMSTRPDAATLAARKAVDAEQAARDADREATRARERAQGIWR